MDLRDDIQIICEVLQIRESDLAKKLGVSLETINNWKFYRKRISLANLERLYSFAYDSGIELNSIYEQLMKEEYQKDDTVVLFHGAKKPFSMPIDFLANSKPTNDFGTGFYLGETFEQAANYISVLDRSFVYCFKLNLKDLKTHRFNVDTEWMLTIAYFRGWLDDYRDSSIVRSIVKKVSDCDIVIAPIADNRMFDLIAQFVEGEITDEQCRHSLAATDLGPQYVIKSERSLKNIELLQELYVCEKEKQRYLLDREKLTTSGAQKIRAARVRYRNKGRYIEEILK